MLPKSNAGLVADQRTGDLVLDGLPNGELAWLRVEPERYVLTDLGRRELAMEALFGPWPTVAEACVRCSPTFAAGARTFAIPRVLSDG